jgi:hypothetical protein
VSRFGLEPREVMHWGHRSRGTNGPSLTAAQLGYASWGQAVGIAFGIAATYATCTYLSIHLGDGGSVRFRALENYNFLTLKTQMHEPFVFGKKRTPTFAGFSNEGDVC